MIAQSPVSSVRSTRPVRASRAQSCWQAAFLSMLPAIERHARITFRHLSGDNRDDAVQEVICHACLAYGRLVEQGRAEMATWSSLAGYAVRHYRAGRRVGSRCNTRDVLSPYCRRGRPLQVERLHRWDEQDQEWCEVLVEDRTVTPADLAATRIDYAAFLRSLSRRERKIAQTLASGESPGRVARMFRLSAARISQIRRQLEEAWQRFHGLVTAEPIATRAA